MSEAEKRRKFLVVVDDTPECRVALYFACRRAHNTRGGVMLLRVLEPADFQHWQAVEDLMREEAREEAEALLHELAAEVNQWADVIPEYRIREGRAVDEILALIDEERDIGVLVLGAAAGTDGPGPLVSRLAGAQAGAMRVPVTVVPGSLSPSQIDAVT